MILGLTGAFGGGKSTVLQFFAEKNWFIFDADAECHKIYSFVSGDMKRFLLDNFGADSVAADSSVNRKIIAGAGFNDPGLMKKWTDMLYPELTARMVAAIEKCRQNSQNAIFELPLLFEAGFAAYFDRILAIWSDPEIRIDRLKQRGFDRAEVMQRDSRQLDPALKLERADYGVINNGSRELLIAQLNSLLMRPEFK